MFLRNCRPFVIRRGSSCGRSFSLIFCGYLSLRGWFAAPTLTLPHGGGDRMAAVGRFGCRFALSLCGVFTAPTPGSHEKGVCLFYGEPRPSPTGVGDRAAAVGCYGCCITKAGMVIQQPFTDLSAMRSLPRGGGLGWGQQAIRTATTTIRQPQRKLPPLGSLSLRDWSSSPSEREAHSSNCQHVLKADLHTPKRSRCM